MLLFLLVLLLLLSMMLKFLWEQKLGLLLRVIRAVFIAVRALDTTLHN